MISGKTQLLGVVGDPIAHSLSPRIHNHWLSERRIDAVYLPVALKSDQPAADLRVLRRSGFIGLNVTLPYKTEAFSAASAADSLAREIGAANTLVPDAGAGWQAYNTDFTGFLAALKARTDLDSLGGAPVILIGAGGSARAAALALASLGVRLTIANRSPEKAKAMADALSLSAQIAPLSALESPGHRPKLIVNATSAGWTSAGLASLPAATHKDGLYFDLSYGEAAAQGLGLARAHGWAVEDGLAMLVHQAADAFALWFGERPDALTTLQRLRAPS